LIAILGGLGAALCFAASTLCSARSSRMIGSASVVAWVMVIGLVVTLPLVAVAARPDLSGKAPLWLVLSGLGNVCGLLVVYAAFRLERVGIVAPITSTEGAIAALIAGVAGEEIGGATGVALAAVAVGVVLAGIVRGRGEEPHDHRGALLALGSAGLFGVGLYATGRVGADLPIAWAVLPARLVGVLLVTLPLLVASRLRLTREAVPLVLCSGLAEVVGFASYAIGARHGIAISAVLASQFAAISAVAAYFLFGERLAPVQIAGVATIAVGVAALTALQG
jgi:drug/metabolite transporter (DMT)-like permease